jgi:hypothetical protein
LSAQHRQEAEVAAAEESERAAVETAATVARVARLAMVELAAARAEVEAAVATDATRAVAADLKALRASSTDSVVSADDDRDNELKLAMEAAREQAVQWAAAHPQGRRGGSPDGRGRAGGVPGGGARADHVPDSGGSPDRRGRVSGSVDGDCGLYRRRDSPSPDRYHGHHGIQAIVRGVGPGGGWPTLTKTNYVEWATVMRVRLQDVLRVAPAEALPVTSPATRSRHETAATTTVASLAIGPRSIDSHDTARPTSHRWRRRSQLCSWHMQASSYLQRHRPHRLSFTMMS